MRNTTLVLLSFLSVVWARPAWSSPEVPGAPQARPIALVGGTLHPVSGPAVPGGTLLFEQGKITALGADVPLPANVQRLEIPGKHVYPGLIDAWTNLGLVEINSIRATLDDAEQGEVNPNVRSWVAINPDSELIPVTRSNGILLALSAPNGRLISGRSAVIQLDGWTWEDMVLRSDVGLHVNWPLMSPFVEWLSDESAKQQMDQRDRELKTLEQAFRDARAYGKARRAPGSQQRIDARWEAMLPLFEGTLPLYVAADEVQQIQSALAFCEQQQIKKVVLVGGYDAPLCAELLKQRQTPVIVAAVYRLPRRQDDAYDAAYTLPERLRQAGLSYCISGSMRFGASMVRNLPYHAATAVGYGLPAEEALKAITLYPAQILGVSERVGSLEPGKDATLIVTDGDPLETSTQVEAAYIQGRAVELDDRHQRLYRKYQEKYRRQGAPAR